MRGEVLFLAHRMPFPPDRGDKIRSFHVLRHLAALGPVHVATFADTAADLAHAGELAGLATSHCLVQRRKPLALAGAQALAGGQPVSLAAFHSARLKTYVRRLLRERPIEAIYVFSGQMGQYVPHDFPGWVVADFVDVDSAKFEAYGADGRGLRSWIDAREARLLRAEEARMAMRADCSLFVSEDEAALFAQRLDPEQRARCEIRPLRNGVDCGLFDPANVAPEPALGACSGPRLIFTGQMDYAPNIAAATRTIDRIMPYVRAALPAATFHVVGRNPPDALKARHGREGCHVWGEVPDIRPWLRGADIALVPLEIARGVQNKVLEAMAMALPVVLTTGAANGIGAQADIHLAVADSDEALAAGVLDLARNPDAASALGGRARQHVHDRLSWAATLEPLEELLHGASPLVPRRVA